MSEIVTIPISFFEFLVEYEHPQFKFFTDRASIVQDIFGALQPWQPSVDDVDVVTAGKLSEQGFTIKIPLKRVSLFCGPASCKFTRENADWQSMSETSSILDAAVSALAKSTSSVFRTINTAISMHVQPKSLPFVALLSPFIPQQLAAMNSEPATTMAAVVKWPKRKITIDGSGVLANAIFLRLEREFPANTTYESIAAQLRKDEDDLFGVLGVEEERV